MVVPCEPGGSLRGGVALPRGFLGTDGELIQRRSMTLKGLALRVPSECVPKAPRRLAREPVSTTPGVSCLQSAESPAGFSRRHSIHNGREAPLRSISPGVDCHLWSGSSLEH